MATLYSTQDKVEASELLFRSMTENSADIIIRQDAESNIIYITPSVFGTTGYTPEELTGTQLFELLYEEDVPAVKTAYSELLQSQSKPVRNEFRIKHKDGKVLWMEGSMVNMLEVQGVTSIIVNLRDV